MAKWKATHEEKKVFIQEIEEGGLKMPDIKTTIKSIRLAWIKRLSLNENNFTCLAKARLNVQNLADFLAYKNDTQYLQPNLPIFYSQILQSWYDIYSVEPLTNEEVQLERLWHNKYILIGHKPVFYQKWKDSGINRINDILSDTGNFKTSNELYHDLQIRVKVLDYNSLKSSIPQTWKRLLAEKITELNVTTDLTLKIQKVAIPIIDITCKEIYWELLSKFKVRPIALSRWEDLYIFVHFEWEHIFRIPYTVARETSLHSLQYQIIHRYFPCARNLHKWYPNEPSDCIYCHKEDSLEHYFSECENVKPMWTWFKNLINQTYQCNVTLSTLDILFGITYHVRPSPPGSPRRSNPISLQIYIITGLLDGIMPILVEF